MGFQVQNNNGDVLFPADFMPETLPDGPTKLVLPFGEISMEQWSFNGIRMGYSEAVFHQPMEVDWQGDMDIVTMHFNLKGRTTIRTGDGAIPFAFGSGEHNLLYGQQAEGKMAVEDLRQKMFMVHFSRTAFFAIAEGGNEALMRFADEVATQPAAALSPRNLPLSFELLNCIRAVRHCHYGAGLKEMFLLSKAIEMLVLQAESFHQATRPRADSLSGYDREQLLFARDYLLEHAVSPPTLSELAKTAGINEYKLKRGFRELFGKTVFGYLSDHRLEQARTTLLEKQRSVSDLAFDLGYSSVQHFSQAFKAKFGVPPSKVS